MSYSQGAAPLIRNQRLPHPLGTHVSLPGRIGRVMGRSTSPWAVEANHLVVIEHAFTVREVMLAPTVPVTTEPKLARLCRVPGGCARQSLGGWSKAAPAHGDVAAFPQWITV